MALHALTLTLSVLLIVTFMGIRASPIPISLISRMRRSASTTVGVPTDSTGGATEGVPTTGVPSVTSRSILAGLSTSEALRMHFNHLHVHASTVTRQHRRLYSFYKNERFSDDPNPIVRDMGLSYLPTLNALSISTIRSQLPDSDLVTLHYNNLIIFKDTLIRVRDSETPSITNRIAVVIQELGFVITRLETTMIILGQEADIIRVESSIPQFHTDVTPMERNMRTLYVLQEFHSYMPHVKHDYRELNRRHP